MVAFDAMRRVVVLCCILVAASCGGDDDAPATPCADAMSEAAEVDDMVDAVTDVDPAIAICETLAEFTAASEQFPAALDGADPVLFVTNRCADGATGPLCAP